MEKKLFKLNEDGIAEWIVAESKEQAYEYAKNLWGEDTMKEYADEYFSGNPDGTLESFIDEFVIEEPEDKEFTIYDAGENGMPVTKIVAEWLKDVQEVPLWFCCENF